MLGYEEAMKLRRVLSLPVVTWWLGRRNWRPWLATRQQQQQDECLHIRTCVRMYTCLYASVYLCAYESSVCCQCMCLCRLYRSLWLLCSLHAGVHCRNKQPKFVVACLELLTTALREFGAKVMDVKKLKTVPAQLEHKGKNVREAAKLYTV